MVPTVVISVPTNLLAAILPPNCALVIPAVLDKLLVVNPVAEIVPALIEIPEPAVNAVCFALNIVQSVLLKYPLTEVVAAGIEIVLVTLDNGEVRVNGTSKSAVLLFAAVPKVR